MRAPAKVILIAFSASVIGPPIALACSPQDYMSPEEWQALSPEQRAENDLSHTHDAAPPAASAPAAPPVATAPTVETPAPTKEAAPQVTDEAPAVVPREADETPSEVAVPPVRSERRAAASPQAPQRRVTVRMPERTASAERPKGSPAQPGTVPVARAPVSAPIAPIAARETAVAPDRRSASPRASERRSARRAAAERRRPPAQAVPASRSDAAQALGTEVPVKASPTLGGERDEGIRFEMWAGFAAVVAALGALIAHGRNRPGTAGTVTATGPQAPLDPVEAELQEIIAEQQLRPASPVHVADASGAQEARVADGSSTATNSA